MYRRSYKISIGIVQLAKMIEVLFEQWVIHYIN